MTYDLVIKNGTIIDPYLGLHARKDIAVAGGKWLVEICGKIAWVFWGALGAPGQVPKFEKLRANAAD